MNRWLPQWRPCSCSRVATDIIGGKKHRHWCEVEIYRAQGSRVAQTKVARPTGTNDIQTGNARREAMCRAIRTISNRFQERNEAHRSAHLRLVHRLLPDPQGHHSRAVTELLGTIRMVDVNLPTTAGRHPVAPRSSRPKEGARASAAPGLHNPAGTKPHSQMPVRSGQGRICPEKGAPP